MKKSRIKLFSGDGIDPNRSRLEPNTVYYPDDPTCDAIKFLFATLETSGRGSGKAHMLDIESLPFTSDLAALIQDKKQRTLSVDDITSGMCRIATHFISGHDLIQSRANSYVRCKLARCEELLEGRVVSQSETAVEKDQLLFSSVTIPSSPRDNSEQSRNNNYTYNDAVKQHRTKGSTGNAAPLPPISDHQFVSSNSSSSPPPISLFRSDSLREEHIHTIASSTFALDDSSLSAALNFLPQVFGNSRNFVSRRDFNDYDAQRMQELWDFFDFDNDGVISKDDVLLGVSNMAKNFLATDEFTQLLTNSYIQRKVRRAVHVIGRALDDQQGQDSRGEGEQKGGHTRVEGGKIFPEGTRVVFIDEEGNLHDGEVLRQSQRQMFVSAEQDTDAYYIKVKGIKLYVSARRIRTLTAQDHELFDSRDEGVESISTHEFELALQSGTHSGKEYQLIRQLSNSAFLGDELLAAPSSNGNGLGVMDASTGTDTGTGSDSNRGNQMASTAGVVDKDVDRSPPTTSKQQQPQHSTSTSKGILYYLRSSIQGIASSTIGSNSSSNNNNINDTNKTLCASESQVSSLNIDQDQTVAKQQRQHGGGEDRLEQSPPLLLNEEQSDMDSVYRDEMNGDGVGPVLVPLTATAVDIEDGESVVGGPQQVMETSIQLPMMVPPVVGVPVVGVSATTSQDGDSSLAVSQESQDLPPLSGPPRTAQSVEAMLSMDGQVLEEVEVATGKGYRLTRDMVPKAKKLESYPIYFNRGKNGFFEFNQIDFGIHFHPFMKQVVPADEALWDRCADSLNESNRCFFLHFGVAMGFHPYALQQCFRKAAAELLKYPENEMTIFFGEALESLLLRNDFVDAQVLSAIWPVEFDKFKILIVRVDHNGRIESFSSFRSETGPVDADGEWKGEELIFTLQWNHFTILKPKSDQLNRPITAVLSAASMIGILPLEVIVKVPDDIKKRFYVIPPI